MTCFPGSLATRLGKSYVQKTLEWFLQSDNRFLFHIAEQGKVVGYCGGFIPTKRGDGSSSGMLQHAFSQAVRGIAIRPWLVFHAEVRQQYPFIWRNIKRKLTGKMKPARTANVKPFKPFVGLVVIGVLPAYRGKGIAQQLMKEFERRVEAYQQHELYLSVKKDNSRAIKAYQNFGWSIVEEQPKTYVMKKVI
jgi:ribosomal protein S18 acetylase RimI-like enzyme